MKRKQGNKKINGVLLSRCQNLTKSVKICQHLEKRLNYIASKMEPELLRNNQLRCDTIHRDIKMQANTVENLITRNDVNVKCPGDLMYNTCHKIPYSFGNNKKHLLYKYKSLQIENNNGLKNNYKLTCKEVIHNNIKKWIVTTMNTNI